MKCAPRTSVLVIDPEPVARHGLVSLISSNADLRLAGEADSIRNGRELCAKLKPQLVVIDPAMEGGEGFALLKEMPRWTAKTRAVAFSALEDAGSVQRAFKAGACGYVTRLDPLSAVVSAITGAVAGERHVGPRIAKVLIDGVASGVVDLQRGIASRLSEREWQVFRMIGAGAASRDIASSLGVSVKTIESHQERIKSKLDVHSATQLRKQATLFLAEKQLVGAHRS